MLLSTCCAGLGIGGHLPAYLMAIRFQAAAAVMAGPVPNSHRNPNAAVPVAAAPRTDDVRQYPTQQKQQQQQQQQRQQQLQQKAHCQTLHQWEPKATPPRLVSSAEASLSATPSTADIPSAATTTAERPAAAAAAAAEEVAATGAAAVVAPPPPPLPSAPPPESQLLPPFTCLNMTRKEGSYVRLEDLEMEEAEGTGAGAREGVGAMRSDQAMAGVWSELQDSTAEVVKTGRPAAEEATPPNIAAAAAAAAAAPPNVAAAAAAAATPHTEEAAPHTAAAAAAAKAAPHTAVAAPHTTEAAPHTSEAAAPHAAVAVPHTTEAAPSRAAVITAPYSTLPINAFQHPSELEADFLASLLPSVVSYGMNRVGQNCICTPYVTVYMVISQSEIPYVHRVYL